jgi:hypothetical protein
MKRFPLWLRAQLLRARIAKTLRGNVKQSLILRLDPAATENYTSSSSSENPHASTREAELLDAVRASDAPVVWIGGHEPLAHEGTGKLVRRTVDCGRTVFLETDGFYLRQRIHEFRPVSRLFLTLKFYGVQQSHDLRVGRPGVFGRALEGIRAAKLSGFLICAHVLVDGATDLREVAQLKEQLLGMDVDGLLVSAAPEAPLGAENRAREIVGQKLIEARRLIGGGWAVFSRLIEKEFQGVREPESGTREIGASSQQEEGVAEEGVEVR